MKSLLSYTSADLSRAPAQNDRSSTVAGRKVRAAVGLSEVPIERKLVRQDAGMAQTRPPSPSLVADSALRRRPSSSQSSGRHFFVPILVATLVSVHEPSLLVWALGVAFAGPWHAGLAALRPHAEVSVYLRDAYSYPRFPERVDVVCGRLLWRHRGQPVARRTTPAAFCRQRRMRHVDDVPLPNPLVVSRKTLVALAAIGALTIRVRGLRLGRVVQNRLTIVKVALVLLWRSDSASGTGSQLAAPGRPDKRRCSSRSFQIMFTYSGWNARAYGQVRCRAAITLASNWERSQCHHIDPQRPVLYALPPSELAAVLARLIDGRAAVRHHRGQPARGVYHRSLAASMGAMMIAGPRVYLPWRATVFAAPAGKSIRSSAPTQAIIAQAIWAASLCSPAPVSAYRHTGFAVVLLQPSPWLPCSSYGGGCPSNHGRSAHGGIRGRLRHSRGSAMMLANGSTGAANTAAGLAVIAAGVPIIRWMSGAHAAGEIADR
jgi:hypothetical protein